MKLFLPDTDRANQEAANEYNYRPAFCERNHGFTRPPFPELTYTQREEIRQSICKPQPLTPMQQGRLYGKRVQGPVINFNSRDQPLPSAGRSL